MPNDLDNEKGGYYLLNYSGGDSLNIGITKRENNSILLIRIAPHLKLKIR